MIFYLVTARHSYAIELFLQDWMPDLREILSVIPYEAVNEQLDPPEGVYIFTDLERLNERQRARAASLHRRLQKLPPTRVQVLNRPDAALDKYAFLRRLHDEGVNDYRVFRLRETQRPPRFPVFLKPESGHGGRAIDLLHSQEDLQRALVQNWILRKDLDDSLVIEFCDTRTDDETSFSKYSAFVIGDRIIPRHLFYSQHWVVKLAGLTDAALLEREVEYLETNPHEKEILRVARLGGYEYGRIDYGWSDQGIQVWEFNTNPVILSPPHHFHPERIPVQQKAARRIADGFRALDAAGPAPGRRAIPTFKFPTLSGAGSVRRTFRNVPWIRRSWRTARAAKRTLRHVWERVVGRIAVLLRPLVLPRVIAQLQRSRDDRR